MNAQGEAVGTGDGGIVLALRGVAVHAGERRLLGPIGDIPPAEFEAQYYAQAAVA